MRLTAHISARTLTLQHAGAHDVIWHIASSPAARHFIDRGPLLRFARRQCVQLANRFLAVTSRYSSSIAATTTSNQMVKFMAWV